jgi:hypothetical protein
MNALLLFYTMPQELTFRQISFAARSRGLCLMSSEAVMGLELLDQSTPFLQNNKNPTDNDALSLFIHLKSPMHHQ